MLRLWLEELAKRLWKHRGLMFKSDERMNDEERRTLRELMADDIDVSVLRKFISKVWGIFRDSKGEKGARQRLAKLKLRPEVEESALLQVAALPHDGAHRLAKDRRCRDDRGDGRRGASHERGLISVNSTLFVAGMNTEPPSCNKDDRNEGRGALLQRWVMLLAIVAPVHGCSGASSEGDGDSDGDIDADVDSDADDDSDADGDSDEERSEDSGIDGDEDHQDADGASPIDHMEATPIDGWRRLDMPLSAPMHLLLTARDADDSPLPWPPGTTFTARGGECVYAEAFGDRVLLFAKASCTETVQMSATFGSTTLSLTKDVSTYAAPAAIQIDALVMPDDIPEPVLLDTYLDAANLGLYVGAGGRAYLRARFNDNPYNPYTSWLTPAELSSIQVVGDALTGSSPEELMAASIGVADVTVTFTLPRPGRPTEPYLLEATTTVSVLADLPADSLWIKPEWDHAGAGSLYSTVGEPCNLYHLIAQHGAPGSPFYYREHAWSEATLAWSSTAYATLDTSSGELCPVTPGATELDITLGAASRSVTVETFPPEDEEITLSVQPDPIVVNDAMTNGSCTPFQVFAEVGADPAEDISTSPALSMSVDERLDLEGNPLPYPDWLSCHVNEAGDGLECCSYADPYSTPPSTQPGVLDVWYAGASVRVDVDAVD